MKQPITPERARRLLRLVTGAAVATAAILVGVKLGAWQVTGSVSLLSSMVDSVMDILASLINFFAVRHALQPADREHRFGHGKAEPLAALGQAAFITGSGVFIVVEAVGRLIDPQPIERGLVGIGVMVFAIVVSVLLVAFQRYVVRLTGSTAVRADSVHYASDVLVNAGVIGSLVLVLTLGWVYVDSIVALAIAGFVIYSAVRIARDALNHLMDRELPERDRRRILDIVQAHPKVTDCHDRRTRSAGLKAFIQVHVEMEGTLTLLEAHDISDEVEANIREAFPNAEVIIHADPEGLEEEMPTFARL